jgi:hypothetical protein
MKIALLRTAAATVLVAFVGAASLSARPEQATAWSGPEKAPDFQLTDHTGFAQHLYYYKYAPAIVLMSRTSGSPLSRDAAAQLSKLEAAYKDRGVLFFMIDSNPSDTQSAVATEVASQGGNIPVLLDDLQLVAEKLQISREGEVFVLDPKASFKIAYHGPLAASGHAYTANAIDAVLGGKPVAQARLEVSGGKIFPFPDRGNTAQYSEISYSKTVAPILEAKCVTCHQAGGIAPFAMNSYDVVKGFAPMISETIMSRRMPPWFADPHVGKFSNDIGLTASEAKTLVHWVQAGAPRGSGDDILKVAVRQAPDWPLGKPDVVVTLPTFNIPATGVVDYQNFKLPNPFSDAVWVRAVAIKPGDRSIVHHVTSNYVADPKGPPAAVGGGYVGSYVPGGGLQQAYPGTAIPVPAGGELAYQMHYTTVGKAKSDTTQIGYYLSKTPPDVIRRTANIVNTNLTIPAGDGRHTETAYVVFPADAVIYTVHPHSHFRGYSAKITALGPDGHETVLLSVPHYDFNWQSEYNLAEPIRIKAGTKIIVTEIYDNSEHNPANPDPKRLVTWGEQTFEEMLFGRISFRWVDETSSHPRNDLQAKMDASGMIGGLDTNRDDKVEINELRGRFAALKAHFSDFDLNHDGGLDQVELAAAAKTLPKEAQVAQTANLLTGF